MKKLKEIYEENPMMAERRFQLVKDLCSATIIKDGFSKIRGTHLNSVIAIADTILEQLYSGDDLLTAEKSKCIKDVFGNTNGKLGKFEYEKELEPLLHKAKRIEIEEVEWNRECEQPQLDYIKENLLEKSTTLGQSSHAFVFLSYVSSVELEEDVLNYLKAMTPSGSKCKVLKEKGGYSRKIVLLTIV